jgi:hypothetical protein
MSSVRPITVDQMQQLEAVFHRTHYPDVFLREGMAKHIGLSERTVQHWFSNRRARYLRQMRGNQQVIFQYFVLIFIKPKSWAKF